MDKKKIGHYTEEVKIIGDNLKNYEFVTEDGELITLHPKTIDNLAMDIINYSEQLNSEVVNGLTDEQKDIIKKKQEQTEFDSLILGECGKFYFNFYGRISKKIDNDAMLFRFLYLCTYMNYEGYLSFGRKLVKEEHLIKLLNLKEREYYETKKYLIENKLIHIDDRKLIIVNAKLCKKGTVGNIKNSEVIRMFDIAVRNIYEQSLPREHKKLSLLVKVLPYLNFKHNIICKNVECESVELIKPYSLPELAEVLGYGRTNTSKLKKDLFRLRVNGELVVGIFESDYGKFICVNPRVMYKGTNCKDDLIDSLIRFKNESDLFRLGSSTTKR